MRLLPASTIFNFNPRSSCEERPKDYIRDDDDIKFQSTLLMRGATSRGALYRPPRLPFQSTLLMRGATTDINPCVFISIISIHAPHARSDARLVWLSKLYFCISIHAPHARSDKVAGGAALAPLAFQSTLLMRGATSQASRAILMAAFQSTLLMRGATSCRVSRHILRKDFNPRSSCEERRYDILHGCRSLKFQSTLLMRGATWKSLGAKRTLKYFNPRSSCEERRVCNL